MRRVLETRGWRIGAVGCIDRDSDRMAAAGSAIVSSPRPRSPATSPPPQPSQGGCRPCPPPPLPDLVAVSAALRLSPCRIATCSAIMHPLSALGLRKGVSPPGTPMIRPPPTPSKLDPFNDRGRPLEPRLRVLLRLCFQISAPPITTCPRDERSGACGVLSAAEP